MDIKKNWIPNGPIVNFLDQIKKATVKLDNFSLSFFNKTADITDHQSLKLFWETIQEELYNDEDYTYDLLYHLNERYEIVQIFKGLERGYIMRRQYVNPKIDFNDAQNKLVVYRIDGITASALERDDYTEKVEQFSMEEEQDKILNVINEKEYNENDE